MGNWSVSRRIYLGFSIVLGLLAALAVVSYVATTQLAETYSEYRGTARQTLRVNDFVEDLFEARMAAFKYRIAPSAEAANEVDDNIAEIIGEKAKVNELFAADSPFHQTFARIYSEAEQYRDAFFQMSALQARRNDAVAMLTELGPRAREQLTAVMEKAYLDADAVGAHFAAIAQQELLLGRTYTERYLVTNEPEAFAQASSHFDMAEQRLARLVFHLSDRDQKANAEAAVADVASYRATAEELRQIITERNAIRSEQLDTLGPKMQAEYEEILEAIVARQNTIGPAGLAAADQTLLVVSIIAVLSLAVGAGLALLISGSVTRSVRRMAGDMAALANDDLEVEIVGADRDHELGQMAKALAIFKENALKVRRLAEAKSEADARAAEERRRMMGQLQAAFGAVVEKAVAGDFSGRVPATFPDDELNELANSVNGLLENVNTGVGESGRVLAEVAQGALQHRMKGDFRGAFAALQQNVNDTVERLADLVMQISSTTGTLRGGADDIATAAEDLSARTEQQASSLEETAATMEEMSASIRSNADSSANARTMAAEASQRAGAGGQIVQNAISAMTEIEVSAKKIADIITVIDSIAFQTNLLALNAAVEAARAGEAGKGFAVVASEVGALAQRSSEASRDIRNLIEISANQVAQGVKLVTETGTSLDGIVASISEVEQAIGEIASASVEQASGVEEITAAVSDMDRMTQDNASAAERSASNARGLARGAEKLQDLIAFFRVDGAATDLGRRGAAANAASPSVGADGADPATDDDVPRQATALRRAS